MASKYYAAEQATGTNKEDLWDVITDVDPQNTYLMTTLGTVKVSNVLHQWPNDSIGTISAVEGEYEGFTPDYADGSTLTRSTNYTSLIHKSFQVTETEIAVEQAGYSDRLNYEQQDAMVQWKNAAEYALIRSTLACGNGSTVGKQMKGIEAWSSTLHTAHSGLSLDETKLNDHFGNAYTQGIEIDTVLVNKVLKRRISSWTQPNTRNVSAESAAVYAYVDTYFSDFGKVDIVKHRYMQTGDEDLLGIQSKHIKIGLLRRPKFEEIAKTADARRGYIVGELTVQVGHEKAVLYVENLN